MCLDLPVVNAALGLEFNLTPIVSPAADGDYASAEYFDRTALHVGGLF
ncbi:MAG: hypothetical protein ACI8P0_000013 [Planctomycetaceae bacterium]|jgi:hypothetical protein